MCMGTEKGVARDKRKESKKGVREAKARVKRGRDHVSLSTMRTLRGRGQRESMTEVWVGEHLEGRHDRR